MIRYLADADLHYGIVLTLRRREPAIDILSAAEGGLGDAPDPLVLEIAASMGRILVSHDRRTMIEHFRARIAEGRSSPDLFLASQSAVLGGVAEALLVAWAASDGNEWRDQITYLPSFSRHLFQR